MSDTREVSLRFGGTTASAVAAAYRPKRNDPKRLFVLFTRMLASGEWDIFLTSFEHVSGVKGIKLLFPPPNGLPLRYACESAGMPVDYWPVFIAVLEVAVAVDRELGDKAVARKRLRDVVMSRVMASPDVQDLAFS